MTDDRRDAEHQGQADRPPTAEEEKVAERAAEDVDVESVGENFEEMSKTGAEAKGEGRIS